MGRRELQLAMADRALWSDAALCGRRHFILMKALIAHHGASSRLPTSIGRRLTGGGLFHPSAHVGVGQHLNVPENAASIFMRFADNLRISQKASGLFLGIARYPLGSKL